MGSICNAPLRRATVGESTHDLGQSLQQARLSRWLNFLAKRELRYSHTTAKDGQPSMMGTISAEIKGFDAKAFGKALRAENYPTKANPTPFNHVMVVLQPVTAGTSLINPKNCRKRTGTALSLERLTLREADSRVSPRRQLILSSYASYLDPLAKIKYWSLISS
jgi:hypothetical protein